VEPRIPKWTGYIALHLNRGVKTIEIYHDEPEYVDIYIDGEMADDVPSHPNEWADYLGDEYGNTFFEELYHYPGQPVYITDLEAWVNA
jgi:hypothetical protein